MRGFVLPTYLLVLTVLMASAPAIATTTTVIASRDNTLYEDPSGSLSNGAGTRMFVGRNDDGDIRRGLVYFDIASAVPAGSVITDVELTMFVVMTMTSTVDVSLHRLLSGWGEASSFAPMGQGIGAPAVTGDSTWLHTFFNDQTWTNPGGDFIAAPSAVGNVGGVGQYIWGSTNQMVSDVQFWLDVSSENNGWLLKGDESISPSSKAFATHDENLFPEIRPALRITYEVPSPGGMGLLCLCAIVGRTRRRRKL